MINFSTNNTIPLPKFIEVETSSMCNRSCKWCPNGKYSYRKTQNLMDISIFTSLIIELTELKYKGWLALHNFNEPLLNKRIYAELNIIKETDTLKKIALFTNGDFLTFETFMILSRILKYMRINIYPCSKDICKPSNYIQRWIKQKKLAGLGWRYKQCYQGCSAIISINSFNAEIIYPDLKKYNYRGGLAYKNAVSVRTKPCSMTKYSSAIDYKGNVKLCCNVFADHPTHRKYIVGNLTQNCFKEIWNSDRLTKLRKLHAKSDWSKTPICTNCNHLHPIDRGDIINNEKPN